MKLAVLCLALFPIAVSAVEPTVDADDFVHFPKLAERVLVGDAQAFRQLLAQAEVTPPGQRLEELAELSSRYVRLAPVDFLRAQANAPACFGVSFMGTAYVDDPAAKNRERALRRKALGSVTDPTLSSAKQRCLEQLGD